MAQQSHSRIAESNHRFNDDLLLFKRSRDIAKLEFPEVFHVLDNPEIRAAFEPIDASAKRAKRRSQKAGFWAVVLAVLALIGASSEPQWHGLPSPWPMLLTFASAALGIAAFMIAAFGVLHGRQKDKWLELRLRTERLRQLHFQSFIWNLHDIAGSLNRSSSKFLERRRTVVEAFIHRIEGHSDDELNAVLAPTGGSRLWLFDGGDSPPQPPPHFNVEPLFKAYRILRFDEQLRYAEHKLKILSFAPRLSSAPLHNQRRMLRAIWSIAFGGLVLLHVSILVSGFFARESVVQLSQLHIGVIWLALIALGARTLEEGLGLSQEIERYEDYRAAVSDTRERFDRGGSAVDKLRAMMDMERISFDEMRSFLRTARNASFVL